MKLKFKKTFSTAASLALAMGLAVSPVSAEEIQPGSITIKDTQDDVKYEVYKLFDLKGETYENNVETLTYSIDGNTELYKWLVEEGYLGSTNTLSKDADGKTVAYRVNVNGGAPMYFNVDEAGAPAFVNAFIGFTNMDMTPKPITPIQTITGETGEDKTIADLTLGYYVIVPRSTKEITSVVTTGALANLLTNHPNDTIESKAKLPFPDDIKKVFEPNTLEPTGNVNYEPTDGSVNVGSVLKFTLHGLVPNVADNDKYEYTFTDTMTHLTLVQNDKYPISIKVGEVVITDEVNNLYTISTDNNTLTVKIEVSKLQDKINAPITITYYAKVDDSAITNVDKIKNNVTLKFGANNSEKSETENLKTSNLVLNKVDDATTPLAGAKFTLQQANGDKFYYSNEVVENNKVYWTKDEENATQLVTDDQGALQFGGIEKGSYILKEVVAPDGYTCLTNPILIDIDVNGKVTATGSYTGNFDDASADKKDAITVINTKGSHLPSTGGTGTTVIYLVGGMLVVGAAILLVTKKRTEA